MFIPCGTTVSSKCNLIKRANLNWSAKVREFCNSTIKKGKYFFPHPPNLYSEGRYRPSSAAVARRAREGSPGFITAISHSWPLAPRSPKGRLLPLSCVSRQKPRAGQTACPRLTIIFHQIKKYFPLGVCLTTMSWWNPVSRLASILFVFPINYGLNYIFFINAQYNKINLDRIYIFLTFVLEFTIYINCCNVFKLLPIASTFSGLSK